MCDRERRFVARFTAFIFQAFEQRGFFAKDVPAGRNKDLNDNSGSPSQPLNSMKLRFEGLALRFVLVANKQDCLRCSYDHRAENHSLEHEMAERREDFAVLEGAGFALVGV